MPAAATLQVLDGHDSIGGTKILLATGEHRVLLDFGTNYRRMSQYYADFLRPRASRGVLDFLVHGLLPPLAGAYRRDLFPPDEFPHGDVEGERSAPTAVLLTHAHLDHCGAIAFLEPSIPVYSTPTTLAMLRSWQETGKADLLNEVVYCGTRTATASGILRSGESKEKHQRSWRLLGEPSSALIDAVTRAPTAKGELIGPAPADGRGDDVLRELHVESRAVDHSLMGAAGFVLDVDGARVAYTGDVRFHGERRAETEGFLQSLERRSPDVLLVEGTRLERPGATERPNVTSEPEVRRNALTALREFAGKFAVADFGPRNVERLRLFRDVAHELDRQLVITDRDAHLLTTLSATQPDIPVDFGPGGLRIWTEPSASRGAPWQHQIDETHSDARIDRSEIERRPGHWLLCFSYHDVNDLVDLRRATRGGAWLYSSSEAHGEEQEFDFQRLQHWIEWAGMHAVGFTVDPASGRPHFPAGLHASGHATQSELIELVRRANPRTVIPVHSEVPELYRTLLGPEGARVVLPRPDVPLDLARLRTGVIS
jgi:ribonuclease J